MIWLAVAAISVVGGFVQGAAGFGYGLVVMALLALLLDVPDAAAYTVLAALTINAYMLWRLRPHLRLAGNRPIWVGVVVGAPLGVWLLAAASAGILRLLLGLVLAASAVNVFWRRRDGETGGGWHPWFLGLPCGILSGALSGAYGTGGPPLVAYVSTQGYDRLRYAATVQMLLATSTVIRLFEMWRRGILEPGMLPLAATAAVGAAAGAVLGVRLLHRLPDRGLRRGIGVALALLSIRYLVAWFTG